MMHFTLENKAKCGINREGEALRQQHPAPNHSDPVEEDRTMADYSPYGESTPVFNPNQELPDTRLPIGGAA